MIDSLIKAHDTLYIEARHLLILQGILKDHPGCYVFGSRTKGTHQRFSDLDLCFIREGSLSIRERAILETAFEESNLPFTVDIVDNTQLSSDFRHIIDHDKIAFPYGKN